MFEILKTLPAYGKMYIPIPKNNYSEGLPIRFKKDDGTEWIANFELNKDDESLSLISELKSSGEIIVIANDVVYLINKNIEFPIVAFSGFFEKSIVFEDYVILISPKCVVVIKSSKQIKFLDQLNYTFTSDVKFEKGFLIVHELEYSGYLIHRIELGKLEFVPFEANKYYISNQIS